jgi:hypothetical protein
MIKTFTTATNFTQIIPESSYRPVSTPLIELLASSIALVLHAKILECPLHNVTLITSSSTSSPHPNLGSSMQNNCFKRVGTSGALPNK